MRNEERPGVRSCPLQRDSAIRTLRRRWVTAFASGICTPALLLAATGPVGVQDGKKDLFPGMAAVVQYRMADRSEEIAMARSAAPASISDGAEVLVLGDRGYETAIKGKNGFVCLVERSWFAPFEDAEFWNPKTRSPICLNPPAASTVLPVDLEKTQWALSGVSKADMVARIQSSAVRPPAPGSIAYMMSKQGHLSDAVGHWHPHLMFFQPHVAVPDWGANLPGSPVLGQEGGPNEPTVYIVPLSKWSDGTSVAKD
jgi:hypothetical protein